MNMKLKVSKYTVLWCVLAYCIVMIIYYITKTNENLKVQLTDEQLGEYMSGKFLKEFEKSKEKGKEKRMKFEIVKTWDGVELSEGRYKMMLAPSENGKDLSYCFPLSQMKCDYKIGNIHVKMTPDYEERTSTLIAEAFFLNDSGSYLEVELCPHGQHLVLMLHGVRNMIKDKLDIEYKASLDNEGFWTGEAVIPGELFPPKVSKFNAYTIHGSGDTRVYQALYPVPEGKFKTPDFHRLEYFQTIDFKSLLASNWSPEYSSDVWKNAMEKIKTNS
ncbi:hypothetical protein KUTeg_005750 [Tegillarca granosa]|uniref:Uncharacterized protein n=1 Tax=Tegillarca granosa TaxID=220873 RepID=A0ABQ9FHB4_TEGGR|nr:hypothetical protein KUTeg_005750 [Tegillarca granosa]